MLKIVQLENRHDIQKVLDGFDPGKETWIVSDLKSKFEVQNYLLKKNGYYTDSQVLRISDFWSALFARVYPKIKIISSDFASLVLKNFLQKNSEAIAVNSNSYRAVMKYIDLLAPILLHPNGDEQINAWFLENEQAVINWKDWYLVSKVCVKYFLSLDLVLPSWIPSLLQRDNHFEKIWSRNIILDLGSEITRVEAENFRALSRFIDVKIIQPHPKWSSDYSYLLKAYDDLSSHTKDIQKFDWNASQEIDSNKKMIHVLRFSGMLAEVKQATAQVRNWVESGIPLNSIGIIAPDIELYWPVLSSYLQEEGIAIQKEITTKYISLPQVSTWLSNLRSQYSLVNNFDLENAFYKMSASENLRYEEFQALFINLYGREDLSRHEEIKRIFQSPEQLNKKLKLDEFIYLIAMNWQFSLEDGILENLLKEILKKVPPQTELSMTDWIVYLESVSSQKEIKISEANSLGITVVPLMSAHTIALNHRIFLGLSEEQLQTSSKISIPAQDVFSISNQLGFYLENPEQNFREFELRWIAESNSQEDIYCFPVTDFTGRILTPCQFWLDRDILKSKHEGDSLFLPQLTVWDSWSQADAQLLASYRGKPQEQVNSFLTNLEVDRGQQALPTLSQMPDFHLSPTAIEDYLKCPFIFASKKIFKLKDLPEMDLDADRRTKGSIIHALFDKLTQEPMEFERTEADLSVLLDQIYENSKVKMGEEKIWKSLKNKYIKLAQRFLATEKEWRKLFPKTKTVGREKDFVVYYDYASAHFLNEEQVQHVEDRKKTIKIIGKIDRIDTDQDNHFIVIDYKSSAASLSSYPQWFDKKEMQLLFYMWIIENNFIQDIHGQTVASHYYSIKDLSRQKGFQDEEFSGSLFPPAGRKSFKGNIKAKEELLQHFEVVLKESIGDIKAGLIEPTPFDKDICKSCEWSRLCRITHQS